MTATVAIVVPTLGRPSLVELLAALAGQTETPGRVVLVDDRPASGASEPLPGHADLDVMVIGSGGRGPAAARNAGWRAADAEWIAFLDDDVVPPADWFARLLTDLAALPGRTAASQGRIVVPRPPDRAPTDWERNVAGLERARWATADMAYRRSALSSVGGFEERFPRAYREDADLALRVTRAGGDIVTGARHIVHRVRPADRWVSLRLQRGNADDVLMRALHGPGWRADAGAPAGRGRHHLAVTAAGGAALALSAGAGVSRWRGRSGRGWRRAAAIAASAWLTGTAEFTWTRVAPGPRTVEEITTMALTSVALPVAATWHTMVGIARLPRLLAPPPNPAPPAAVLFDRDGTLIRDVPYNGDPGAVVPMPGARRALDRLRSAGVRLAVVSNQSGVGRGLVTRSEVEAVNRRTAQLLGPLGPWVICPHEPAQRCWCRKPAPGLVLRAADALGVAPSRCAVVGDIGADVDAALAAGARPILVPTPHTRTAEVESAPEVARDLGAAVAELLGPS